MKFCSIFGKHFKSCLAEVVLKYRSTVASMETRKRKDRKATVGERNTKKGKKEKDEVTQDKKDKGKAKENEAKGTRKIPRDSKFDTQHWLRLKLFFSANGLAG